MEVADNLAVIRKYLQNCSGAEQYSGKGGRGCEDAGSVRHIHSWLNQTKDDKNSDVMSIGKICEFLKAY